MIMLASMRPAAEISGWPSPLHKPQIIHPDLIIIPARKIKLEPVHLFQVDRIRRTHRLKEIVGEAQGVRRPLVGERYGRVVMVVANVGRGRRGGERAFAAAGVGIAADEAHAHR